jgi:hypothetical protein
LIGLIPLLTGVAGMCPLYSLLGISTWKTKSVETQVPPSASH